MKDFEPSEALFCQNIEEEYQTIINFSHTFLKNNGDLYLELNAAHANSIMSLFNETQWAPSLLEDYDNKPRLSELFTANKILKKVIPCNLITIPQWDKNVKITMWITCL